MKLAQELCWQTTKQYQLHKTVLISLQAMFNMSSPQPKDYKIRLKFNKAIYQFNIKQVEMCSLFCATLYINIAL